MGNRQAEVESGAKLQDLLRRIDGRGYKAYKDLSGRVFAIGAGAATLHFDTVQGDPFAAPSRVRLRMPMAEADLPSAWISSRVRRIALQDFLAREARRVIRQVSQGDRGSGNSGRVGIDAGRQTILDRTAAKISDEFAELRLEVGLPASGRRVLGREAEELLLDELPEIAEQALCMPPVSHGEAKLHVETAENHDALRTQLSAMGLVAFIADGSLLPRESGASDRPAKGDAVRFETPPGLRVTLELAHPIADPSGGADRHDVSGMGIPEGVTVIVGGGYHGKSTLLRALERGVYAHIPGDGRERVATASGAVKIRAEDGRRVEACDISPFIRELPQGLAPSRSTASFRSDDASGSTSQAANMVEAIEAGSRLLLLDEDTSATNFMVRDARMQALVHADREPITPFVDRVRSLADDHGVSCIIVMGGSGDYFEVADTVIEMHAYGASVVTEEAKRIASEFQGHGRQASPESSTQPGPPRVPLASSLDASRGRHDVKVDARRTDALVFGTDEIDLRGVEQLVDPSQTRAIGLLMARGRAWMGPDVDLGSWLDRVEAFLDDEGLDAITDWPTDLARPRRYELAAALNRLRTLRVAG